MRTNIRHRLFLKELKKKAAKRWYTLMKPVANLVDVIEMNKRKIIAKNTTREKTAKALAQDYIDTLIKYSERVGYIHIAESVDIQELGGDCIGDRSTYLLGIRNKKTIIMFNNTKTDIPFQELVVEEIKKMKGVTVEKTIIEIKPWVYAKGYRHTYKITIPCIPRTKITGKIANWY